MISQTSEEFIMTAPTNTTKISNQDLKPQKLNARTFDFLWWRDSRRKNVLKKEENQKKKEDLIEVKIIESKAKNTFFHKTSFDFFKNIKKHMQIKKLTHKSKQRTKEVETSSLQNDTNYDLSAFQNNKSTISTEENNVSELKCEDIVKNSDILNSNETLTDIDIEISQNQYISEDLNKIIKDYRDIEKLEDINEQIINKFQTDINHENISNIFRSCSSNKIEQLESRTIIENNAITHQVERITESTETNRNNDNKIKASLTEELLKLSNYGWYWGPISGNEADAKLLSEPDGAFLVRDSSDDRYVLTLSFKSSGKLLHARMEHSGGLFSLCNQSESEGFSSVADLIDYSMNFSQSAVFCYSRPKYPGHPSFPVRLTKPVSRFTQVRSLQYLCRFVIRQNTRLDNIHKLPLPKTIKGYIEEAHY
ncbi:suppressor of cytokine signaling 4-like [Apis laboriosa]|uniref:suppressor of cytokine signaling 4-like n=1 Tax=Apis laboriosa TaxID=183418 RepID=UPI001CC71EBC|nr:suppressor of cytokine signaling 4-like [Apis laboriosa]